MGEGYSLWLMPPPSSALFQAIEKLISTSVPYAYCVSALPFPPHVTLTAGTIFPDVGQDPVTWFETRPWPEYKHPVRVTIAKLHVGDDIFKKLTMRCSQAPQHSRLYHLAAYCRGLADGRKLKDSMPETATTKWVEDNYLPHCSLMYSTLPVQDVESRLDEVNELIRKVKLEYPGAEAASGAEIWLMPTFKAVQDWQPVAKRELPGVEWEWITAGQPHKVPG